jgi:hypothetical protein
MPDPKTFRTPAGRLQCQCVCCGDRFFAHSRLGARQKTCGNRSCQKFHRARYRREYRLSNPQAEQDIRKKRAARRPPDYWREYRKNHPASTARNQAGARLRKRLIEAGLQRQLDIVQLIDPIGKLHQVVGFATSHRSLLEECLGRVAA